MRIIKPKQDEKVTILIHPDGNKHTPCNWNLACPVLNGDQLECEDCPADNVETEMSYREVLKFFKDNGVRCVVAKYENEGIVTIAPDTGGEYEVCTHTTGCTNVPCHSCRADSVNEMSYKKACAWWDQEAKRVNNVDKDEE